MASIFCPACGLEQPTSHGYCVRCGAHLPVALLGEAHHDKRARWFAGVRVLEGDPDPGFLKVSCYLTEQTIDSAEGTAVLPGRHVRFSVWDGRHARCVVSLPESEARDMASFIAGELGMVDPRLAPERAREGS